MKGILRKQRIQQDTYITAGSYAQFRSEMEVFLSRRIKEVTAIQIQQSGAGRLFPGRQDQQSAVCELPFRQIHMLDQVIVWNRNGLMFSLLRKKSCPVVACYDKPAFSV
jgi:hypothetical protein